MGKETGKARAHQRPRTEVKIYFSSSLSRENPSEAADSRS